MKQRIKIEGKNLNELFALPCVECVRKRIEKDQHIIVVDLFEYDDAEFHRDNEEFLKMPAGTDEEYAKVILASQAIADKYPMSANEGDWLVERDDGSWRVEKGDLK